MATKLGGRAKKIQHKNVSSKEISAIEAKFVEASAEDTTRNLAGKENG